MDAQALSSHDSDEGFRGPSTSVWGARYRGPLPWRGSGGLERPRPGGLPTSRCYGARCRRHRTLQGCTTCQMGSLRPASDFHHATGCAAGALRGRSLRRPGARRRVRDLVPQIRRAVMTCVRPVLRFVTPGPGDRVGRAHRDPGRHVWHSNRSESLRRGARPPTACGGNRSASWHPKASGHRRRSAESLLRPREVVVNEGGHY